MSIETTGPIPRTPAETMARLRDPEVEARDFAGTERSRLLQSLSWQDAQPFLRAGARTEPDWNADRITTREQVVAHILAYLPFAWGKANSCRGLSSLRSLAHFAGLAWLLGPAADELVAQLTGPHAWYGKANLVRVSGLVGYDWRTVDSGLWQQEAGGEAVTADDALAKLG